jgi:hypothetical protein
MGAALSVLASGLAVEQACWHSLGTTHTSVLVKGLVWCDNNETISFLHLHWHKQLHLPLHLHTCTHTVLLGRKRSVEQMQPHFCATTSGNAGAGDPLFVNLSSAFSSLITADHCHSIPQAAMQALQGQSHSVHQRPQPSLVAWRQRSRLKCRCSSTAAGAAGSWVCWVCD